MRESVRGGRRVKERRGEGGCVKEKRGGRMSKRECEGREDERGESVCV